MDQPKDLSAAETRLSMSPDVRISVTNFGPIAEGTIDLRPLTVFVGPSNTGKTYFAVLIYALHRVLSGLSRFPFMDWLNDFWPAFRLGKFAAETMWEEELQDVLEKLDTEGRPFRFSDLPESVRDVMQTALEQPSLLGRELWTEFGRCFDLESVLDLIRSSGCINRAEVSLEVSEEAHSLWRLRMEISESDVITMDGQIEDMFLFPGRGAISEFKSGQIFRALVKERGGLSLTRNRGESFENFFRILLYLVDSANRSEAHYLPAARSGIMQIHRVIASSAVARSTRTPLEPSELPTLSGVMADFIQRLILYNESRAPDQLMRNLADALERETLTGQIRTKPSSSGGYPEFVYRPLETERDVRLSCAPSMVSELAPVVLFLRGAVNRGDMLIIEEPEAHLHPAAQTQMAVALARLVRAGVRIVVTTHSDWLLQEIGNLIREGELEERTGEPVSEGALPSALRPSEVGVWLFRGDGGSAGSTVKEIPFDRGEGVDPREYEDVAEELYNRSANLQNRLEEITGDAEHDDE